MPQAMNKRLRRSDAPAPISLIRHAAQNQRNKQQDDQALKITAGGWRFRANAVHDVQGLATTESSVNNAGTMRSESLLTTSGDGEGRIVKRAARHRETRSRRSRSIWWGRYSRVTSCCPPHLAAWPCRCSFTTPTSACANAGASFVPSPWPQFAGLLLRRMYSVCPRAGFGDEVVDTTAATHTNDIYFAVGRLSP